MSALVRLYPAAWRARYGAEFETLLAERPPTARDLVDIVIAAADARISPQVAGAPGTPTPLSSRISGASAILGGLLWCVVILVASLDRAAGDLSLPVYAALGLMLFSLPGRYMRRYAKSITFGVGVATLAFGALYAEIVPWDLWMFVPVVLIFGVMGPGAFALAAARAGIGAATRWRLVALVTPWPLISVVVVSMGLMPELLKAPVLLASLLPIGIAWMATGARLASGRPSTSMTTRGLA
ncbi:MAG TPA: hypothetical protein VIF63_07760 [Candidatus Limnocylindrales bacterium]|jgi:hypothetical protein